MFHIENLLCAKFAPNIKIDKLLRMHTTVKIAQRLSNIHRTTANDFAVHYAFIDPDVILNSVAGKKGEKKKRNKE